MPKKPNRAAQLQNYVPAGNGDASGEYADEETGSNIHFTNFKKPDEEFNEEEFNKNLIDGLVDEGDDDFSEEKLIDGLDEYNDENQDQPDVNVDGDNNETIIDELDGKETKEGILNLNPELDKDKVMALSEKDANKLLKAINLIDNQQKELDKLKKKYSKQEWEGIWKDKQTISSLAEKFGSAENVLESLNTKQTWAETNKPELAITLQGLDKEEIGNQVGAYLLSKQKLDAKIEKAKNLLSKYENPNNLYSQAKKDKAVWCKNIYETKKVFPSITTKGITSAEMSALQTYSSTFSFINEPLRGITYSNANSKKTQFINTVKNMTSAIDKSVIDFDFWTQRGTSAVNFPSMKLTNSVSDEQLQSLVGTTFEDQAFVSTGAAKGTGFSNSAIILNIYCPKGTKGAYIDDISHFKGENELILQRGYSYRVTKVEKKNGKIYMDCDLLLGSDKNKFNNEQLEQIKNKYFI